MAPIYYRDAKGAILVYDVSISDTFKRVKKWKDELNTFNKNAVVAIAGNKCDLKRDIEEEEILEYSEIEKVKHFYTSAKTGEGLDEIFMYITREIVQSMKGNTDKEKEGKKLVLGDYSTKQKEKGCCK